QGVPRGAGRQVPPGPPPRLSDRRLAKPRAFSAWGQSRRLALRIPEPDERAGEPRVWHSIPALGLPHSLMADLPGNLAVTTCAAAPAVEGADVTRRSRETGRGRRPPPVQRRAPSGS